MKNISTIIMGIAIVLLLFWGCNKNNNYQTSLQKANESSFIINYLKETHPETKKLIKEARDRYLDLGSDDIGDNETEGTIY